MLKYISQARTDSPELAGEIFLREDNTMATTLADYWKQSARKEGIQQGEGTMLICQLECKFKSVPKNYRRQVEQASPELLLKWAKKVLTSQSLEEVFK